VQNRVFSGPFQRLFQMRMCASPSRGDYLRHFSRQHLMMAVASDLTQMTAWIAATYIRKTMRITFANMSRCIGGVFPGGGVKPACFVGAGRD